jgi:hypothetical protein
MIITLDSNLRNICGGISNNNDTTTDDEISRDPCIVYTQKCGCCCDDRSGGDPPACQKMAFWSDGLGYCSGCCRNKGYGRGTCMN